MAGESADYPIIDSHIHLYPASEIETLAWCKPSNPLHSQHSLKEFAAATGSPPSLEGFIFLETDRKHDLVTGLEDGSGWEFPLMEVDWLKRIALGTPKDGEGHISEQKKLCLAIIPWAPVPSGAEVLERYVKGVEKHAESSFGKIRGFRYLVQDKPKGTMLQDEFIEGLKWLGKKGFVFDLGVDQHRGGKWQLEEAVEMIEKAHEGVDEEDKVTFILSEHSFCLESHFLLLIFLQTIFASRTFRYIIRQIQNLLHGEQQCSDSANAARRI
jgi:L-rhamnono-1,4-lactonase